MPDRYGNPPDDRPLNPEEHICYGADGSPSGHGWLGVDHEGKPRPCVVCKPWATPQRREARIHGPHHRRED